MKFVSHAALVAVLTAGVTVTAIATPAVAQKKKKDEQAAPQLKLSEEFRKAYAPAETAINAKDWPTALTALGAAEAGLASEATEEWQAVFDGAYAVDATTTGPTFTGWNSSYTGEAIPLAGSRALIVDDNPTNREILATLARRRGMEPILAASADEALPLLQRHASGGDRIPLMLLDLHMPGSDGFQLAERIRAERSLDDLAIVLLTSAGATPDLRRCADLRIATRLIKPVKE